MPFLIPIIIAALSSFVVRLLLSLGIGWGTYTVVLPNLMNFIFQRIQALPPVAYQTLGVLQFDICVSMIVSAYAVKTLAGFFITKITP